MGKWRSKLYKTDRARDFDHERDRQVRARQVYETIDRQPFQWVVTFVAGIGFFLDGYTLFASNIAMPMVAYVYWKDEISHDKLTWINTATLIGTMFGQILFGILADMKGRKKMYGMELVVLTVSTLGTLMASTGSHNSMSVFAWLVFWRFATGVGVGADYPLSAIISSEFAPTAQRARMLATVFFMQPLGQMASNIVSMTVITITRRTVGEVDTVRAVDIMWRWIVGIGVFPGLLAIVFRLAIPETPRFTLEIQDDPVKAEFDTTELFGDVGDDEDLVSPTNKELEAGNWMIEDSRTRLHRPAPSFSSRGYTFNSQTASRNATPMTWYDNTSDIDLAIDDESSPTSTFTNADWTLTAARLPTLNSKWSLTRADLHQYFIREKNYLTLLGTSLAWLLQDFGFYGIGLSSPHFIAQTWGSIDIHGRRPPWQISDDVSASIYDSFFATSLHGLVILNLGTFLGSFLLILCINRLNRVSLQRWGFLILALLFIGMGLTFMHKAEYRQGPVATALFVIAMAAFNFGPNATTFILPAELFPTRYRATCYGISAAAGKLGGVIIGLESMIGAHQGRHIAQTQPIDHAAVAEERASRYAKMLFAYAVAMVLGVLVSLWVPQVQDREDQSGKRRDTATERVEKQNSVQHQRGTRLTLNTNMNTSINVNMNTKTNIKSRFTMNSIWTSTKNTITGLSGRGLRSKTLEELSAGRAGTQSVGVIRARRRICQC